MAVGLSHYLTVAAILFTLGIFGIFINRKNVILLLMCIELMLLAVNFNFVAFSRFLGNLDGQVFVFFILTVAAAEAAIGLRFDDGALLWRVPIKTSFGRHVPSPIVLDDLAGLAPDEAAHLATERLKVAITALEETLA